MGVSAWRLLAIAFGTILSAMPAYPQAAPPPAPQGNPEGVDPMRLPGDRPPPPLADMLRYPRPHPASEQAPDLTRAPPMALALEAARVAVETCTAEGLRVGVAVLDSAGQLRVALTAEQAKPGLVYFAARKGLAALAFRTPTSEVQARLRADPAMAARVGANMAVGPGAVPLLAGGGVVGAIGASGATAQQDEACAAAGAAGIKDRLR